jgi:integrase/recombinase XerD
MPRKTYHITLLSLRQTQVCVTKISIRSASEKCHPLIWTIILANIETLGLLIQDLEFHRNGIWIRRRKDLENEALAKSLREGEERFIDLSPELMALLDHLLLQHTFETDHLFVVLKRNAKDKWGNSTYGHPLDREAVKALFRYYSRKSGIVIHAHQLRHSHATELIRAGWDASYVQQRLGHAQVQTTINTYVHLTDEDLSQKWRTYQEAKLRDTSSST